VALLWEGRRRERGAVGLALLELARAAVGSQAEGMGAAATLLHALAAPRGASTLSMAARDVEPLAAR
jgi:hypothetical protein